MYDCCFLFCDKMYSVVTMTFPISDASKITTITAIAIIKSLDIELELGGQLEIDGNNVAVVSGREDDKIGVVGRIISKGSAITRKIQPEDFVSPSTVSCMLPLALLCSTYSCPDDGSTVAMQVILNWLIRRVSPVIL